MHDAQFMTSNLVSGFFTRCDRVRKYAFSAMLVCGTDDQHVITGCWLFRGQGIPDVLEAVDDTDLYTWTKANLETDKAKIEDYFAWEGSNLPGPRMDGKTFK